MRLELLIGGKKQQLDVNGDRATIGGADDDTVRVLGAPPKLVELRRDGSSWFLRTRVQGRINGVPFPELVPRVWVPGETLSMGPGLSALYVTDAAAAVPGTAAVAKDLLGSFEPTATRALPVLICLTGVESGRRFPLSGKAATIGRAEDVAIRLRDSSVSRRHAMVEEREGRVWIEDLDSPNGVFVNGRRLSGRAVLPDGAVIEMGQTLLRFQLPDSVAAAKNEAPPAPAKSLILSAEPPELPMAAEPEAKLQLVRQEEPESAEDDVAIEPFEPTSPSKNQVLRLSAIAARIPKLPSFSAVEWALIAGGGAMMILGVLVAWSFC